MSVLVTGASGALGPHLLAELLQHDEHDRVFALVRPRRHSEGRFNELRTSVAALRTEKMLSLDRLIPVVGDIRCLDVGLESADRTRLMREIDVVIHAAANTRFTAPAAALQYTNVEGTRHVLKLAADCQHLRQFLLVSTTCVAGCAIGTIAERLEDEPPAFVNAYERTKWEAERLAAASHLPVRIARLATCVGGERDGYVHRFGAIHRVLYWLTRGLLPVIPAVESSQIDMLASDVAARWIGRAASEALDGLDVCHVAAGDHAIPIGELMDHAIEHLRTRLPAWRDAQIEAPALVDATTFGLVERAVAQTGDALLKRVVDAAGAFLPALLYPKVFETLRAERVWGGRLPLTDWRATLRRVIDFSLANDWRANRAAHV